MILDIFAIFAFVFETPNETTYENSKLVKNEALISSIMLKHSISQAIYQLIVLIVLLFNGKIYFK